ncbi:MAG: hypothetical protein GY739_02780 [Mesoflavibacter sp.]|nr:hypothetical protein [Mesoflavibacter sp.]
MNKKLLLSKYILSILNVIHQLSDRIHTRLLELMSETSKVRNIEKDNNGKALFILQNNVNFIDKEVCSNERTVIRFLNEIVEKARANHEI